ncbi:hypothetical protein ACFHW2_42955 [Actinomadura sp. LOL_016]|uniref:hypothetical protein n=1 Tax=unclassified Actinomadura TaxID=2626254 RepID=UPI003A802822
MTRSARVGSASGHCYPAAHADAADDGPIGELTAATAAVVRVRPPHLHARADAVMARLAAALDSYLGTGAPD